VPLCILTARPIGVMQMVDQNEEDDKIIAIHEHDPAVAHLRDISQLPAHTLNELQRFFEDYKALENKEVRIERFKGCAAAHEIIEQSLKLYSDTFNPDGSKREDAPVLKSDLLRDKGSRTPSRNARLDAARRHAAHNAAQDLAQEMAAASDSAPDESAASEPDSSSPAPVTFDLRTLQTHAPREVESSEPSQDSDSAKGNSQDEGATPCAASNVASTAAHSAPALAGTLDVAADGSSPPPAAVADETRAVIQKMHSRDASS
jgi:hypothetical protein